MNFSFDSRTFEDVHQKLTHLGELLSTAYPQKSKDLLIALVINEARIQSFLACHNALTEFLVSVKDTPNANPTDDRSFQNVIAPLLGKFYKAGMVTKEQLETFVEQFDSALILSYDICWLEQAEQKALFSARVGRIPRYYYTMSTFISFLGQRVYFGKGAENAPAQ